MANKRTTSPAASFPAYIALTEVLAADPGVSAQLAALKTANDRFDFVAEKVRESHAQNYHQRIRDQQKVVTELQAKFDVGKVEAEDLASAKRELADAKEALELAPGRRKVLLEELEVADAAINAAQTALGKALVPWETKLTEARKALELQAAQLLFVAAQAFNLQHPGVVRVGSFGNFILDLPSSYGAFGGDARADELPMTRHDNAGRASGLLDGAERRHDRLVDMYNSLTAQHREADLTAGIDRDTIGTAAGAPMSAADYEYRVGRQGSSPGTSQPLSSFSSSIGYSE
ncbi:hypothetical protein SAMN05216456_1588 [Devosia crocina]|uniref:Uncharacterized protein n=1 Tax=Devosia crocina TaxID=429728 RepID=A0A1I7NC59_9HYPH|nr:hypothetical protein [Devosia crocina]SFV32258.1 hypothetical protein SAMN05216456_1588 [Devosia crocina]